MYFHKDRVVSYAISPDHSVPLAKLFDIPKLSNDSPPAKPSTASKFLAIHNNDDALAWRIALIEQAQNSIDAQYYSWHTDISGQWLISKLIEAADRGVRVRLLLDDIHTIGTDHRMATLNRHKNIEVRIFNPFKIRWPLHLVRAFELLWNLDRLNHRMHNKVLIADNVTSIIGGRNIGDEFFGLNKSFVFRDLDLLVSGAAVEQLSYSFDLFWNSQISKTARRLIAFSPARIDFRLMKRRLNKNLFLSRQIIDRIENVKNNLINNPELKNDLITSDAQVFYDLPDAEPIEEKHMVHDLYQCNIHTKKQLTIISAYFIPSKVFIASLQTLLNNGVRIKVLTNSLASIDVTAAFTGYERYRRQLLNMGVELFEFRAEPKYRSTYSASAINVDYLSLHAKSIIYDDNSVYVGTLNLDPRSEKLNTEIGLFVKNTELAESVHRAFIDDLNKGEYWQVKYNDQGKLIWQFADEIISIQPARSLWQRIKKTIYSLLPIQRHL
ncbi:MAG: phospholipase D family protein [Gammaproteobacteria bacterium]|nr:phospholipase D family protein [Gammaproteobacteria bacterium]